LIVGWRGQFLFFVVPRQFSQDICEWPENQTLIPDWTYFHCPGATLPFFPIVPPSLLFFWMCNSTEPSEIAVMINSSATELPTAVPITVASIQNY